MENQATPVNRIIPEEKLPDAEQIRLRKQGVQTEILILQNMENLQIEYLELPAPDQTEQNAQAEDASHIQKRYDEFVKNTQPKESFGRYTLKSGQVSFSPYTEDAEEDRMEWNG